MSELMLNLLDAERAIHRSVDRRLGEAAVAALSAEPETIDELQAALRRFWNREDDGGTLDDWTAGTCEVPGRAGICFIDMTARMVVFRSASSPPAPRGCVRYCDAEGSKGVWVWYRLSDDWEFSKDVAHWGAATEAARQRRAGARQVDPRLALYGEVVDFIVRQCIQAAQVIGAEDGAAGPRDLPEPADRDGAAASAISEIHALWLLTPREDLEGKSPREVLLERHELVDFDLQGRRDQWSLLGECPPGIGPRSAAFLRGGFGTHEIVVYYDLVRHLLWQCWQRVEGRSAIDTAVEVQWLNEQKTEWLNTKSDELFEGQTPAEVIRSERCRLPLAVSGEQAMTDCDCPLCQMMAESGPVFLHLDGCHMDDDFAFSLHPTRSDWEAERREWQALAQEWEQEPRSPRNGTSPPEDVPPEDETGIWQRSQWSSDVMQSLDTSPQFLLVAIAACLAELGLDLKQSEDSAPLVGPLNRQFGNLRDVARRQSDTLLSPVVKRLCDELQEVTERRPDLAEKCGDLQGQLEQFTARMNDMPC